MSIWRLVLKEFGYRKLNSALALLAVALAMACLVGAITLLEVHDLQTQRILEEKRAQTEARVVKLEDDMRKGMLGLGFNIVILSKDQKLDDWYKDNSTTHELPEEYVTKLAKSKVVTVQHLLPCLQQRVRWPEKKRTVILVGVREEVAGSSVKKPLQPPVPPGKVILGNELRESLGLKVGDRLTFMDREFTVHHCYPMRGNQDDITAWINLKEAQELLNKPGLISAIQAVECGCAWANLPKVREEIQRILPNTQVIERGSEALARAEARRKAGDEAKQAMQQEETNRAALRDQRVRLASVLVPLVMLGCAAWIAMLALSNVRDRRGEIGILRALGVRSSQILTLFLSKAVITGILGGVVGCAAGYMLGARLGSGLEAATESETMVVAFEPTRAVLAIVLAPLLAAAASWLPAMLAARQDPAVVLREE